MTILGRDIHTKQLVELPNKVRMRGIYCIGKPGTGKSTLIENMVIDSMERGVGLCFIDPHGDTVEAVIRRIPQKHIEDVIFLDMLDTAYPFPLNLFFCSNPQDPEIFELSVESILQVFAKVLGMDVTTPRLRTYVQNISRSLIRSHYTMLEIPLLLFV